MKTSPILALAGIVAFAFHALSATHDGALEQGGAQDLGYSLSVPGLDGACALDRSATAERGLAALRPGPGCAMLHPAMARVRYWSEERDGSVSFLSAEGESLIRFGVADGPGYESFAPASAHLVLATVAR